MGSVPSVDGFDQVPFGNLEATKAAVSRETGAILIEPIMGEGGVRVVEPSFLRALRELCDQHGLLLLLDEVQTGMGRTGELFAHQRVGVEPDIMATRQGAGRRLSGWSVPRQERGGEGNDGRHAWLDFRRQSACHGAANAVLDVMLEPGFLDRVRRTGLFFKQRLAEIKDRYPSVISEVRGEGLLVGVRASVPAGELVDALRAEKMIAVAAGDNVVRLLPPLIISEAGDRRRRSRGSIAPAPGFRARRKQRPRKRRHDEPAHPALSRSDRRAGGGAAPDDRSGRAMKAKRPAQ